MDRSFRYVVYFGELYFIFDWIGVIFYWYVVENGWVEFWFVVNLIVNEFRLMNFILFF